MDKTFLFYDIETTGLNKAFDQILQFAAIRTDKNLNELESCEISIKLNPDVIPSPRAMITHHMSISESMQGMTELEAIYKIHQLMNTPNTISIGYNTLGFDDEFLRFSFFRHLLPPYTHQYANGCSRSDLFPITIMYYLFEPTVLQWPRVHDKISLKLSELSKLNRLAEGAAHTAIVDVRATIELAKKFLQVPKMWQYLLGYFDKQTDQQRMLKLLPAFKNENFREGLMIDSQFGTDHSFQSWVLSLGQHRHYQNQSLWLRLDTSSLENPWVIQKKYGEPGLLLPLHTHYLHHFQQDRQKNVEFNKQWCLENKKALKEIQEYYCNYQYPSIPNIDECASLYTMGFLTPYESQLCAHFHKAKPNEKLKWIQKFENPVLKSLGIRLMGKYFPDDLNNHYQDEFELYLAQNNKIDYRGQSYLTAQQALTEIDNLLTEETLDKQQQALLIELKNYLSALSLSRLRERVG